MFLFADFSNRYMGGVEKVVYLLWVWRSKELGSEHDLDENLMKSSEVKGSKMQMTTNFLKNADKNEEHLKTFRSINLHCKNYPASGAGC